MAEAVFDKDGNLTNVEELTSEEINSAWRAKNQELFNARKSESEKARLAKEEAERVKAELETERKKNAVDNSDKTPKIEVDPEELKLIARGLSDEEIEEAKAIAKGKGVKILEALETPIFKLYQNNLREEKKKEAAKLGASAGSGQVGEDITFKPGMKTEEHKEAWAKRFGK